MFCPRPLLLVTFLFLLISYSYASSLVSLSHLSRNINGIVAAAFSFLPHFFSKRHYLVRLHPTLSNHEKSFFAKDYSIPSLGHPFKTPSTYIFYLSDSKARRIQKDARVVDLVPHQTKNRLSTTLRLGKGMPGGNDGVFLKSGRSGNVTIELVLARMFNADGPSIKKVVKRVRKVVDSDVDIKLISSRVIQLKIPASRDVREVLECVQEIDGIVWVEQGERVVPYNMEETAIGQSGASVGPGVINEASTPIWKQGLMGEGEVGAIADTGIDTDSCYFRDSATTDGGKFDGCNLKKRKIVCYFRTTGSDFGDDAHSILGSGGHGTHTSSSMGGLHASIQPSEDTKVTYEMLVSNSDYANGVAPLSKIAFTDIGGDGTVRTPVDFATSDFFANSYNGARARIFSISWGCQEKVAPRLCNRYDISARSIDEFVWNNKDFLLVMAAGNTGHTGVVDAERGNVYKDGSFTVSAPSTAKNVLTVGASQSERPKKRCKDTGTSCSAENLFGPSSRGPTFDGRVKPDVFFPGVKIMSATSSGDFDDFSDGRSCRNVGPTKGVHEKSGTSMSAPLLSGLAILVRQYYREFNPHTGQKVSRRERTGPLKDGKGPSAALVRATLINGARSFKGLYSFRPKPDADWVVRNVSEASNRRQVEGFGRVQLDTVLNFGNQSNSGSLFVFDRHKFQETGEKHRFVFDMTGTGTLKATLSWTDPAGPLRDAFDTEATLVNDLDISASCGNATVTQCKGISVGMPFSVSKSSVDNVEQISSEGTAEPLTITGGGRITLEVAAKRIEVGPQPFALVVSGSRMNLVEGETAKANWKPDWGQKAKLADSGLPQQTMYILAGAGGAMVVAGTTLLTLFLWNRKKGRR